MEKVISALKGNKLATASAAYRAYCKLHRLPVPQFNAYRDHRRQLPRIPSERVLQASLAIPRSPTWRTYWRLLYETGPRPSEPFDMRVRDVDLETEKVRLGTLKYGGDVAQRELLISPLLSAMLRELIHGKKSDDFVFSMKTDPSRPLFYHRAEKVMEKVRRQLRSAGYDVQGLRLHIYRHAFRTRLYTATRDLSLVQRSLVFWTESYPTASTTKKMTKIEVDQTKAPLQPEIEVKKAVKEEKSRKSPLKVEDLCRLNCYA